MDVEKAIKNTLALTQKVLAESQAAAEEGRIIKTVNRLAHASYYLAKTEEMLSDSPSLEVDRARQLETDINNIKEKAAQITGQIKNYCYRNALKKSLSRAEENEHIDGVVEAGLESAESMMFHLSYAEWAARLLGRDISETTGETKAEYIRQHVQPYLTKALECAEREKISEMEKHLKEARETSYPLDITERTKNIRNLGYKNAMLHNIDEAIKASRSAEPDAIKTMEQTLKEANVCAQKLGKSIHAKTNEILLQGYANAIKQHPEQTQYCISRIKEINASSGKTRRIE